MARLPFNPDRIPSPPKPPRAPGAGGSATPLTVSQLAGLIKAAVAENMPPKLRVVGEVSNVSLRGHCFFSLKDEGAAIRCVAFASAVRKWSFPLTDGMQVVATGRVDFYDAQGSLQLYVDAVEPVGQGALELRFRALCDELRGLGYFAEERKRPLPVIPGGVAVITSRTGAALQDVINTAGRRWAGCRLLLYDVRVQGAGAAPEIAAAIAAISRDGPALGIDAVILTRGGGSMEDLWAFNERTVAEAIYRCRIPIVAAIGHETDTTIAELVADRRCSTPTQAAMTLIPDRAALDQQAAQLAHRLALVLRRRTDVDARRLETLSKHPLFRRPLVMLESRRDRVKQLAEHPFFRKPQLMLEPHRQRLAQLAERLTAEMPRRARQAQDRAAALARQLAAVGPANVLKRGYSYTLGPDGRVLLDAEQVKAGDAITSVLAKGRVASRVEQAGAEGVPMPRQTWPAPGAGRKGRSQKPDRGPGLFDAATTD